MTKQVFNLPDLGEGLTEAQVVTWLVQQGDTVSFDQPVVEVETAKALVAVPVPFAGQVVTLHAQPGETVVVGDPLITVAATVASGGGTTNDHGAPSTKSGSGAMLVGYGTDEEVPTRRRRRVGSQRAEPQAPSSSPSGPPTPAAATVTGGPAARVISPVVRELARRNGVDVATVAASGAGGVICRADVEAAIASAVQHRGTSPDALQQRIPLTGLRKAVTDKVSASHRQIPKATTWVDVDATGLLDARAAINAAIGVDEKISLLALLARLTVAALYQYPELNATVDTDHAQIVQYRHVNLGVAAQTPRGLMVPVIDRADTLDTIELGRALSETTALARSGKLPPARLTGSTFTLNNYGVFGTDGAAPIINHPEVAMLGVGRIVDKPWVVQGELAIRKVTQLSITFDHRACDGGSAGGFLRLFADYVASPIMALGRL